MKTKCLTLVVVLGAFLLGMRYASAAGEENPYIELYKLRVAQAELGMRRQAALADLAQARMQRARQLIAGAAMSREEYDVIVSEVAVTSSDRALAEKKIAEANAYLKIITGLVKRGVSIPLCTYEME